MNKNTTKIDFLIIGALCNSDLLFASQLKKMGISIKIFRKQQEIDQLDSSLLNLYSVKRDEIELFKNKKQFIQACYRAKVILSCACALPFYLGKYIFLMKTKKFPPVVSQITGSDLTELPFNKGLFGFYARFTFQHSFVLYLTPMNNYISALKKLKFDNFSFSMHPYLLNSPTPAKPKQENKITFIHTANIDWGATDTGSHRNSTKGTDRFIHAFIQATKKHPNIECMIMERGPDVKLARKIITEEKSAAFQWIQPTTQDKLHEVFAKADIVVDQFDLGAFGGLAIESMSAGRPVLTYIDPIYAHGLYHNDPPPIFNASSTDEIKDMITKIASTPHLLEEAAQKSLEWVKRNYDNTLNFIDLFTKLDIRFHYNFLEIIRRNIHQ